jgi:hypothetical protein
MAGAGPEQIFFEDAPLPEVRRGDVLVQVRATGITPAELTWDETCQHADGVPTIPSILGMRFREWWSERELLDQGRFCILDPGMIHFQARSGVSMSWRAFS